MARHARVVCVQVPCTYIAQGPSARMQYLQRLADEGRLHVIAGAGVRNNVTRRPTLWLLIFQSNAVRGRELATSLQSQVASIHFHGFG